MRKIVCVRNGPSRQCTLVIASDDARTGPSVYVSIISTVSVRTGLSLHLVVQCAILCVSTGPSEYDCRTVTDGHHSSQ